MTHHLYHIDAREPESDGGGQVGLFVVAESAREAVALWQANDEEAASHTVVEEHGWTIWRRLDDDGDPLGDIMIHEVAAFLTASIAGPSRVLANEEFPPIDAAEWAR